MSSIVNRRIQAGIFILFFALIGFWLPTISAANEPDISADVAELVFDGIKGTTSAAKTVNIINAGDVALEITAASIVGGNFAIFTPPSLPITLNPGGSQAFQIKFTPGSAVVGAVNATLRLTSNDPDEATFDFPLYGLSTNGWEGSNEPTLANVVLTLGYAFNVGWTGLTTGTSTTLRGDETNTPLFRKAEDGNITITPVARYSPVLAIPFGYYLPNGSTPDRHVVGTLSGASGEHQTLYPALSDGGTTFDPGSTQSFGIYVLGLQSRYTYTEDPLNEGGPAIHAVRIYPLKNRQGVLVPNAYYVAFEDASNGDYQDYDFVLTNVQPSYNPYISDSIADQQAVYGQANSVINLHNYFADDQDVDSSLIFSVTENTNSSVVTTSITDGNLTLDFNSVGISQMTVQAQDTNGNTEKEVFNVTVSKANTTLTLTNPPATSVINQPQIFTFSLTVNTPGAGTLTGNVTVSDGTSSCVATVTQGQCSITFHNPGSRSITATYDGNTNYNGSSSGSFNHTVTNPSPIAANNAYNTEFETSLTVNAPGVLENDSDPNGDSLTAVLVADVSHGSLSLNANGAFSYTPQNGFSGQDGFSYRVYDGSAFSNTATVTITVGAAPTPNATNEPTPTETAEPTPTATDEPTQTSEPMPTQEPPVNNPGDMAVGGNLNSGEIHPVFTFIPPVDDINTSVLADWYYLVIVQNGVIVVSEWFPAASICSSGICTIQPGSDLLPFGLLNGDYEWYLQAWTEAHGFSEFVGPVPFSVTVPMPVLPTPQTGAVDTSSGRPVLHLPNDPGTTWYQIYLSTSDFSQIIDWQWYPRDTSACNETTCTLIPDAHPMNGDYVLYIQSWGPAGFANSDPNAWEKLADFHMDFAAPQRPAGLTSSVNTQTVTLQWQGEAGATWYHLWLGTTDYEDVYHYQWHSALSLSCEGGICTAVFNLSDLSLQSGSAYTWFIQAWGPGGMSSGGDFDGWAQGMPMVIP